MTGIVSMLTSETAHALRRRAARWLVRATFGPGKVFAVSARLPMSGVHRILVCRISHTLGNTLLLTPLLRELERTYPGAEVDVLTRSPVAAQIFGGFSRVRYVHLLPGHGVARPWRVWQVIRAMRARHYDLAIDPSVGSQSDRLGILAARARSMLGYTAPGKGGWLTHGVAVPEHIRHVGQLPVHLLRQATATEAQRAWPPLDLCLTDDERRSGAAVLTRLVPSQDEPKRRLIGVFTGATGRKQLDQDWWRRFAGRLTERTKLDSIVEIVPVSGKAFLADVFPTFYSSDLRELACVLSGLSLFVSADCGVMHLACAAGAPTVGLFAVTDPTEWGPYGPRDACLDIGGRTPEQSADALCLRVDEQAHID